MRGARCWLSCLRGNGMRVKAILNREGGTLATADMPALVAHIEHSFGEHDHEIECEVTRSSSLMNVLSAAGENDHVDCIVAGGGDGTISAAAGIAWRYDKTLGVLPAGTMNLFAHSLQIPLNVHEAVSGIARGKNVAVDIATANGRPFVHQYSVGFQAQAAQLRDKMKFGSRFGKMLASVKAVGMVIASPPSFECKICGDLPTQMPTRMSAVAVTNNIFGEGHMPYADKLDAGKLGVISTDPVSSLEAVRLAKDIMLGHWAATDAINIANATRIDLLFPRIGRRSKALLDGELIDMEDRVEVRIHNGALNVLVPGDVEDRITV